MSKKIYLNLPGEAALAVKAQTVLGILFLPLGILFLMAAEGEARPFVAVFSLIWTVGCLTMIYLGFKAMRLMKKGNLEVAEIKDDGETQVKK